MGFNRTDYRICREVKKLINNRIVLERLTIEGESPVNKIYQSSWIKFPSTAGHVESCGNLGGPSPKTKYYLTTDSEPVP